MTLNYEYDESDETWPFFLLTVLLMVLVPATVVQLYRAVRRNVGARDITELQRIQQKYSGAAVQDYQRKHRGQGPADVIFSKRSALIIVGWVLVSYLVNRIASNETLHDSYKNVFDPYELLQVGSGATDREIRSAYRKLSVKFHPDKLAKDLQDTERSVLEEQYVLITKAYKALTDDATRDNFLRYGHPDGPQSTTHGIALPKFLIEGSGSPLVVVTYFLLLALVLPGLVTRWWANTQSYTNKGLNTETASYFVDKLFNNKPSETVDEATIMNWLSHAKEYRSKYPGLTAEAIEGIFQDHIHRRHSGPLEGFKFDIIAKSAVLLHGLLDIAASCRNTEICIAVIETSKSIVQALPASPNAQILQLPNVEKDRFLANSKGENVHTIGKLFTFDDNKIGKLLGIEDPATLKETLYVASQIPHLKVIDAQFKVPGEASVTPSSTPHIVVKVLVRSAKHKMIPATLIPNEKLQESEDFGSLRDPFAVVNEQPLVPATFAPYFPTERHGGWCALVVLQKDGKIIQTPLVMTRLSFANLAKDFDKRTVQDLDAEFNPDDWEVGTIKIPLAQPAPPEKGDYFFRIIIKSTEYFGGDLDFTMPMQVREPVKEDELDDTASIGDDTAQEDSDSDEENELDNEDSDYTDIDTDTEVEDNITTADSVGESPDETEKLTAEE
ncbi:AAL103Wp [Eremothecium gossypii ATCC 10895]|uniref:AAL103Wp n=1 Tax=Eremothecium gossypii (strain ATCC 10895 / CBS 109.51 / FGSC 9923 / NRRL Y-1056) TaxID=284811 RepID=Q75F31_EREGS|nr:AAL103Wp [Eremothecium gossypii ATCC 10895]AAS50263.1 AAL103Wp [Eremothecium gossypii ATCC 10895]AEY94548.1 FAAL103Wp [Eremothecium gossypii FDAG1]